MNRTYIVTPLDSFTKTLSLLISHTNWTIFEKKVAARVTSTAQLPYTIEKKSPWWHCNNPESRNQRQSCCRYDFQKRSGTDNVPERVTLEEKTRKQNITSLLQTIKNHKALKIKVLQELADSVACRLFLQFWYYFQKVPKFVQLNENNSSFNEHTWLISKIISRKVHDFLLFPAIFLQNASNSCSFLPSWSVKTLDFFQKNWRTFF